MSTMAHFQTEDRGFPTTVVAFSGLAPHNYIYEWSRSFAGLETNFIGIRDPDSCWYQNVIDTTTKRLRQDLRWVERVVFIGASAGGFAALMFSRSFTVHRIIAFCPQSACGGYKRALGDDRWMDFCRPTPNCDIAGPYPSATVHIGDSEPLDTMHAGRLGAQIVIWPGGHDLPHELKAKGLLEPILRAAI